MATKRNRPSVTLKSADPASTPETPVDDPTLSSDSPTEEPTPTPNKVERFKALAVGVGVGVVAGVLGVAVGRKISGNGDSPAEASTPAPYTEV